MDKKVKQRLSSSVGYLLLLIVVAYIGMNIPNISKWFDGVADDVNSVVDDVLTIDCNHPTATNLLTNGALVNWIRQNTLINLVGRGHIMIHPNDPNASVLTERIAHAATFSLSSDFVIDDGEGTSEAASAQGLIVDFACHAQVDMEIDFPNGPIREAKNIDVAYTITFVSEDKFLLNVIHVDEDKVFSNEVFGE